MTKEELIRKYLARIEILARMLREGAEGKRDLGTEGPELLEGEIGTLTEMIRDEVREGR